MIGSGSMFGIVSALVSAGMYAGPGLSAAPAPAIPDSVIADIRQARVDIYTSRGARAAAEIQSAREHVRRQGPAGHAGVLKSLDEAAWQVRRHRFREAGNALDDALLQLPAEASPDWNARLAKNSCHDRSSQKDNRPFRSDGT